jgi:hypothetical protein
VASFVDCADSDSMKSISKHAVVIRMFLFSSLVAVVMITIGPSGALAGQGLHVVSSPFISNSSLSGTAAIADNDIWAVGMIAGAKISNDMTLAEHFNGASWSVIFTPTLQGAELAAVDGVASNDVWAVGAQMLRNNGSSQPLIDHWDGTSWSIVSSPSFPNGGFLTGVAAVSANDAWAVGTASGSSSALVEHWDGTSWSIVSSPAFTGGGVSGIAADASNDVWAVGGTTKLHFNGTSWSAVPAPTTVSAGSVTVLSPSDAWAAGGGQGPPPSDTEAMLEQWNGTSWTIVPSPNPDSRGTSLFTGIAAVSASDIYAVGDAADGAFIEHWNGKSWSLLKTPSGVSDLNGVTALSDGTVVAVGLGANGSAVILHN